MRTRNVLVYLVAAGVAVAIGLSIGYFTHRTKTSSPAQTGASLLQPPRALPDFNLVTDKQAPFARASLENGWSLPYFGYTHCPDVCPTTLVDLNKVSGLLQNLPADKRPQVYSISVDPKRDTLAGLAACLQSFNKAVGGVTGPMNQLRTLTKPMGVGFSCNPENQTGNYAVNHSAVVFLVNPEVRETALFTPPIIPGRMANAYRAIVTGHGAPR